MEPTATLGTRTLLPTEIMHIHTQPNEIHEAKFAFNCIARCCVTQPIKDNTQQAFILGVFARNKFNPIARGMHVIVLKNGLGRKFDELCVRKRKVNKNAVSGKKDQNI